MPEKMTALHMALDLRGNGELPKDTDKVLDMDKITDIIKTSDKALLDAQNQVGQTAIHMMSKFNPKNPEETLLKKEIAQMLIDAGADLELVDSHGNKPMHIACMTAEPMGGITDKLCKAGASITDKESMFDYTPLHWAAQTGLPEVIKPLLDLPNVKEVLLMTGRDGKTPLDIAKAGRDKKPYPYKSSSEVVKMIEAVAKAK